MLREIQKAQPRSPSERLGVERDSSRPPHELVRKWQEYLSNEAGSRYRTYSEFMSGGNTYFQAAIAEGETNGREAATELLEIAKTHYLGALGRGNGESEQSDTPDPMFLARFGCLYADLASSTALEQYQSPETNEHHCRREDICWSALRMLDQAVKNIGPGASRELLELIERQKTKVYKMVEGEAPSPYDQLSTADGALLGLVSSPPDRYSRPVPRAREITGIAIGRQVVRPLSYPNASS